MRGTCDALWGMNSRGNNGNVCPSFWHPDISTGNASWHLALIRMCQQVPLTSQSITSSGCRGGGGRHMMSLDADTMTMVRVLRVGMSCCGVPACHLLRTMSPSISNCSFLLLAELLLIITCKTPHR